MGKNLKIVMIDDNTDLLFTMGTFLERNGFELIGFRRVNVHWVSLPNITMKLLRSFQIKPDWVTRLLPAVS